MYDADYPKQIIISIGECRYDKDWSDMEREIGQKSQDLFNVVTFNHDDKIMKIIRIGADRDAYLRHRGTLCLNWTDKSIKYFD